MSDRAYHRECVFCGRRHADHSRCARNLDTANTKALRAEDPEREPRRATFSARLDYGFRILNQDERKRP